MDISNWFVLGLSMIPLARWQTFVAADLELEPVDHISGLHPVTGELIRVPRPHRARWSAGPKDLGVVFVYGKRGDVGVGVHYLDEGGITSTALRELPDAIVDKVKRMAAALDAEVEASEWPLVKLRFLGQADRPLAASDLWRALRPAVQPEDLEHAEAQIEEIAATIKAGLPVVLPWPVDNLHTSHLVEAGVAFETLPDDDEDAE